MKMSRALLALVWHFLRDMVLGGLATTQLILSRAPVQPGVARLPYGDLPDGAAALLGALICLTPGTTTLAIDRQRRDILLHLLDMRDAPAVLAALRRDFVLPLTVLAGRQP